MKMSLPKRGVIVRVIGVLDLLEGLGKLLRGLESVILV
jgi:hypothetical protein